MGCCGMSPERPLPKRIEGLHALASNLWWSWNPGAREVFRRLDYPLWRRTHHNPLQMLNLLSADRFVEISQDSNFLQTYDNAIEKLLRNQSGIGTWWSSHHPGLSTISIAYFSAEFALHQSVPLYAGGLGVLAGDHCKEASDLGVPLIGVGFRYSVGYFQQTVSPDGYQQEFYDRFPIEEAPIERARTPDGQLCNIVVTLGQENIHVAVWLVRVGRVKLYLLDTDVEENPPWGRELSSRLYVGEPDSRLQQEIILGIGGVRALRALGHDPAIWHLNEGHAAFVIFERLREFTEAGESLPAALHKVRSTTLFTTHTPVAAGHDAFSLELVDSHLSGFWGTDNLRRDALLGLAMHETGEGLPFNMTVLALRGAGAVNAVSQSHRNLTSRMFTPIPGVAAGLVQAITNGVHLPTWIAPALDSLFERYLGPDWKEGQDDPNLWDKIWSIPDDELWQVRQLLRVHLLTFIREHARDDWVQQRASAAQLAAHGTLLDPSTLTIGFARRFTDYKRSDLIFSDRDRLLRLLNGHGRPVQFIFAGKAHPSDEPGKRSLERIYRCATDPQFAGRIAFVDDYNLHVARFFVQGCDVWLNNPRKPFEACGTSGMKASINGVAHLSVDDGWWSEGYTGLNGWIVQSEGFSGEHAEADAIYMLLEEQIVPTFYQRDGRGVPVQWMAIVKQAIRTVAPRFCARRMVKEYVEQMYLPQTQAMTVSAANQGNEPSTR
jgi:glycogen phosphorylase